MLISRALPNKSFTTHFHCFLLSLNRKKCYYYYYYAPIFLEKFYEEKRTVKPISFTVIWEQNKKGNSHLSIRCFFGIDNISGLSRITTSSATTTFLKIVETFIL